MAKTVDVLATGKAPKGLDVGDKVRTAGGTYKISKVLPNGRYESKFVSTELSEAGARKSFEKRMQEFDDFTWKSAMQDVLSGEADKGITHHYQGKNAMGGKIDTVWYEVKDGKVVDKSAGYRIGEALGYKYEYKGAGTSSASIDATEKNFFDNLGQGLKGTGDFLTSANPSNFNVNTIIGGVMLVMVFKLLSTK